MTSYEDFKRGYLNTEEACTSEGFAFTPAVAEAVGGRWAPAARKIFTELAKEKSIVTGEPPEHLEKQLHQNLSVTLHRENARAVLKRLGGSAAGCEAMLSAAATLQMPADD